MILRAGILQESIYKEWLYLKIPILDSVKTLNIQNNKIEATADSASKDLQTIQTNIAVNASLDPDKASYIYRNIGIDADIWSKIITPAVQESVKAVTSKYTAEELITKRSLVSLDIKTMLTEKLKQYWVLISDVNIVNFNFSPEFNQSIENKVKAEQDALTEKNKLETVKYQAQQKIEQSKAEAETIRIQAEAIKSQWWAEYVQLKWIEKRDGKLPSTNLWSSSNGLIMNLPSKTN
jgi:regulator of protease activity HflC (stomatin/prohibitin superfamily)